MQPGRNISVFKILKCNYTYWHYINSVGINMCSYLQIAKIYLFFLIKEPGSLYFYQKPFLYTFFLCFMYFYEDFFLTLLPRLQQKCCLSETRGYYRMCKVFLSCLVVWRILEVSVTKVTKGDHKLRLITSSFLEKFCFMADQRLKAFVFRLK